MTLVDDARKVLERSGWREAQQAELARACRALVAKLRETCPDLVVGRPLKPSEVAVIFCRLPNSTFDDVSLPVSATPSQPSIAAKKGYITPLCANANPRIASSPEYRVV